MTNYGRTLGWQSEWNHRSVIPGSSFLARSYASAALAITRCRSLCLLGTGVDWHWIGVVGGECVLASGARGDGDGAGGFWGHRRDTEAFW